MFCHDKLLNVHRDIILCLISINLWLRHEECGKMLRFMILQALKKKIWDLLLLTSSPLAERKVFRKFLITQAYWTEAFPNNIVSSTNCWWDWGSSLGWGVGSLSSWDPILAFSSRPRPSIMIMNIKGERGSPYRIPLEGLKVGEGEPLTRIEKKVVEVSFKIQLTQVGSKPKAKRIFFM